MLDGFKRDFFVPLVPETLKIINVCYHPPSVSVFLEVCWVSIGFGRRVKKVKLEQNDQQIIENSNSEVTSRRPVCCLFTSCWCTEAATATDVCVCVCTEHDNS